MYNREESLAKASKELMFEQPYYGLFLIMLNKVWRKDLPTAGVSKNTVNYQLAINEKFWEYLTLNQRKGILQHELMHIAFFHLLVQDKYPDKKLANIAMDIEINQYIRKGNLPCDDLTVDQYHKKYTPIRKGLKAQLESESITKEQHQDLVYKEIPIRPVLIEDFPELNLDLKAGTDYYYKKLQEAKKDGTSNLLNDLLDGDGEGDSEGLMTDHSTWKEFQDLSEAEKIVIGKQTEYALKNAADTITKSRGTIPGELKEILDRILNPEPPKFDWRGYLRRFAGGSTKVYTVKTRRKESTRFKGNPGLKIKQKKHILVAIDTSGSVSTDELVEFFGEIDHIYRTGAEVTILQCDTRINSIKKYNKTDVNEIHGRGGTSFQPTIDYYNDNLHIYSCLIYLTDGEAPIPEPAPRGKTLWVLSSISSDHYLTHFNQPTIKLN